MSAEGYEHPVSCAEMRDLAPELALGVLSGIPRANALAHLDGCPACRSMVDEMAALGDSLLLLAPETEPPPGFAQRLKDRREPAPSRARPRWRLPALAAGAVAAAAALGVVVGLGAQSAPDFRVGHPATVHALGGRELSAAVLRNQGHQVGQVFVYAGRPSWVFMTIDADRPTQRLTCEVDTKQGATVVVGSFTVSEGYRSWGSTVAVQPDQIQGVRLVDAGQQTVASASL